MVIRELGLRPRVGNPNVYHVRRERPRPAHVTPCFAGGTKRCSLLLRVYPAKLGFIPSSQTSAKKLNPKLGLCALICVCSQNAFYPCQAVPNPHARAWRAQDFNRARTTHLATIWHHLATAGGWILALYLHGAGKKSVKGECEQRPFRAVLSAMQGPQAAAKPKASHRTRPNMSKTCPAPCTHYRGPER